MHTPPATLVAIAILLHGSPSSSVNPGGLSGPRGKLSRYIVPWAWLHPGANPGDVSVHVGHRPATRSVGGDVIPIYPVLYAPALLLDSPPLR